MTTKPITKTASGRIHRKLRVDRRSVRGRRVRHGASVGAHQENCTAGPRRRLRLQGGLLPARDIHPRVEYLQPGVALAFSKFHRRAEDLGRRLDHP